MDTSDLERRIRAAFPEEPHALPVDGIARIHALRLAGERGLPETNVNRRSQLWIGVSGVAAAICGIALWLGRSPKPPTIADREEPLLWPEALAAQAVEPTAPRIGRLDGTRLRPGRWIYARQPVSGSVTPTAGTYDTVIVAQTDLAGTPSWVLSTSWGSRIDSRPMVDSAWVARESLAPLEYRFTTRSGSRLSTTFGADSIVRLWAKPDGSSERIAVATPRSPEWDRGVTLIGNYEGALLQLLPLHPGWRGALSGTGIANTGELVTLWLDLSVEGEETITVPAGTFDCWRLASGMSGRIYWVGKDNGWLIREGARSNRFGRERVLLSYTP